MSTLSIPSTENSARSSTFAMIKACFWTLGSWHDRWTDRRKLEELDDHILKDVGLSRDVILNEANKPFWRA